MCPLVQPDTRRRILEAASQVIAAKSFNGCGLNEILALAGVPKGSFYHYFKSKEDLGVAVVERARESFLEHVRALVEHPQMPALARLRAVFEAHQSHCHSESALRGCVFAKLALEVSELSEPVRAAVKGTYDQWGALLADLIRAGQASGEITQRHDPARLANLLVNLWEGALIRSRIDRCPEPLTDVIRFFFESGFLNR